MILRGICLPLLVGLGAMACVDLSQNDVETVLWDATLTPAQAYPGLEGQVGAVSTFDGTQVGIGIRGAEPGAVHVWAVFAGTCQAPERQIGPSSDYPELAVDGSGTAEGETHLAPRLARGSEYHAEVHVSAADTARIACGDLVAR